MKRKGLRVSLWGGYSRVSALELSVLSVYHVCYHDRTSRRFNVELQIRRHRRVLVLSQQVTEEGTLGVQVCSHVFCQVLKPRGLNHQRVPSFVGGDTVPGCWATLGRNGQHSLTTRLPTMPLCGQLALGLCKRKASVSFL